MAEQAGQAPAAQEPTEANVLDRLKAFSSEESPEEESEAPEPEQASEEAPEEAKKETPQDEGVEIDPDAPLVEITIKGEAGEDETRLWSLNEMRKGVMMEKAWQHKTKELAKARETMDREVQSQVNEVRSNYVQGLQTAEQALLALVVPELNGVDIEKLAAENPAQAVALQARAQKLNNAITNIRQQIAQANQQAFQQMAQQSVRALSDPISGIPGWGDDMYQGIIREGSKTYGFKPEEVANVVDHRMIRALHDALQFKKAQQTKPVPKTVSPKVIKPGAPVGKDDSQTREITSLRARVKKTGDLRDAAALYERMHPNG